MKTGNYLCIRNQKILRKVYISEINYIVQSQRKLTVSAQKGDYEYYDKISNIEVLLDEEFYQVLKYAYINLSRVEAMYDQCIEFCDGKKFYVGRTSFTAAKLRFMRYLLNI